MHHRAIGTVSRFQSRWRHSCVLKQGRQNSSPLVSPLHLFVGIRFQVSFTPLAGVLFTFPSRY